MTAPTSPAGDPDRSRDVRKAVRAGSLVGATVRNASGEVLGRISDLILNLGTGVVAYAVLAVKGGIGRPDKLFAVPVGCLRMEGGEPVLNVPRKELDEAPGFDPDDWPAPDEVGWGTSLSAFYGTRPNWDPERYSPHA